MEFKAAAFFLLGLAVATQVDCNIEGDILYAQKKDWMDTNNVLQSWDPTLLNPCSWYHVTCNNDSSVIRVDLGNAGLFGPLALELGGLKNLQYLDLSGNSIRGTIPAQLGFLTTLVSLDLHHNQLSGPIPASLGDIKSLEYLRLNDNFLTGIIPTEVFDLVLTGNLKELERSPKQTRNVSGNFLKGTIKSPHKRVATIIQDLKSPN